MNTRNLFFLILVVVLASCIKDTGNYDYHEVNSLSIDLGEFPPFIDQFDTLIITPKYTQTIRDLKSNSNLKCLWILEGKVGAKLRDTISRDTVCKYPVLLPPGDYNGTLYVTDIDTDLFYKTAFSIKVNNFMGQGLLVLSEKTDNEGLLTYIKYDYGETEHPVFTNVYYTANKSELGLNPKSIYILWPAPLSGDIEKILINCDDIDGGKVIDLYTFGRISSMKDFYFFPPDPMRAVDIVFNISQFSFPPSTSTTYFAVCGGKLYNANAYRSSLTGSTDVIKVNGETLMLFKPPVMVNSSITMFPQTPYLDGNIVGHGYSTPAFWDRTNHCFTYTSDRLTLNKCYYNTSTNVANLRFDAINLPGFELITTGPFYRGGDSRTYGNSYAVVRETATGKYFCLLIQKKSANEILPKDPYKVEIVDNNSQIPSFDNNSLFLGSVFSYDLYFAIGNKLYKKGLTSAIPTPPAQLVWEAPAGSIITTLHSEALYGNSFAYMGMPTTSTVSVTGLEIYLGVYNPGYAGENKGSVYRFRVSDMGGMPVEINENGWPKLNCAGKIVSMVYKGN